MADPTTPAADPIPPAADPTAAASPTTAPLPAVVRRWLDVAWPGNPPDLATLVLEGDGRVRLGALPALPVRVRLHHRLGRDHVAHLRLRLGATTIVRGIDGFVDGSGIRRVGPVTRTGPGVDAASFAFAWSTAFLVPGAWARLVGVRWEPLDRASARLVLPFRGRPLAALVAFDAETGHVAGFEVPLPGTEATWCASYQGWRRIGSLAAPRSMSFDVARPRGPWLELTVERAYPGVPVDDVIAEARRWLPAAARR